MDSRRLDVKQQFRLKRNQRNFFRVLLLFSLQMMLLFILLWVITLSKKFGGKSQMNDKEGEGDWPYFVLATKFICSVILHVTL